MVVGGEPANPGLVGGTRGRILLVADHSIFINMMMLPTDTDNVEFASNCLEYLRTCKEPTAIGCCSSKKGRSTATSTSRSRTSPGCRNRACVPCWVR